MWIGKYLFADLSVENISFYIEMSLTEHTLNTQPAITCSKLTIETLEQGVKYVQS